MNAQREILGPAALVAGGVALAGALVGWGFASGRAADRFVTVKGVAEREVEADLALWPLQLVASSNDLSEAQRQLEEHIERTITFLAANGVDTSQVERQGLRVTDANARMFGREEVRVRFVVNQTLMVRSLDPGVVFAASQKVGELVASGVVLVSGEEYGVGGPTFLFTGLNDFKPEMIAEATARAREAAEQFADDSDAEIGGIRRANQGVFQILPRDEASGVREESQLNKRLRVVSTIEYRIR